MTIKKYCSLANSQIRISPDGSTRLCCKMRGVLGSTNTDTIKNLYNCDMAKRIRLQLINDEWPVECGDCQEAEENGVESWRQKCNPLNFTPEENEQIAASVDLITGEAKESPKYIEVAFSNLCNLGCKMCYPSVSTTLGTIAKGKELAKFYIMGDAIQRSDKREDFIPELLELCKSTKFLCVTGGEPFMSDRFLSFIDLLGDDKKHINYLTTTNLTEIQHGKMTIMDRLKDFKAAFISVSIEGTTDIHEYIRYPSKLNSIVENMRLLKEKLPNSPISINLTVQALNVLLIPEILDFFEECLKPTDIMFSFVNEHHLRDACLPEHLRKEAQRRLIEYLNRPAIKTNPNFIAIDAALRNTIVRLDEQGDTQAMINFLTTFDKATGQDFRKAVPLLASL